MAKKLSVDLGLNASNFTQGARDVIKQTNSMTQSVQEYVQQNGNLSKQLRQAKRDAQNLAVQFNDLSAAEKDTEFGRELAENLDFAMRKAAELQDVFDDTNKAVKNLSSDTATFDALHEGFSAVGDSVVSVMGSIAALTGKQEDFNRAAGAWMAIENGLSAAIKIKNMLQKQSSVMLAISTLQTKAATTAQALQTSTTVGATVAQKAFNLVAKANPYVLLATAALAVVGALAGFSAATDDAADSQANMTEEARFAREELERQEKAQQTYAETFNDTTTDMLGNYMELQSKWEECGDDLKKQQQFLEDYRSKLDKTGISINDVATAENVFHKWTDKVRQSFIERAKAAAYLALAYEKVRQALLAKHGTGSFQSDLDVGITYMHPTKQNITTDEKRKITERLKAKGYHTEGGKWVGPNGEPFSWEDPTRYEGISQVVIDIAKGLRNEEALEKQRRASQASERLMNQAYGYFDESNQHAANGDAALRSLGLSPYKSGSSSGSGSRSGSSSHTSHRNPPPKNDSGSTTDEIIKKEKELTELQKLLKKRDELEKDFYSGTGSVTRDDFIKKYREYSRDIRQERLNAGIYKGGETRDLEEQLAVEEKLLSITEEGTEEYQNQLSKVQQLKRDVLNAQVNTDPEYYLGPLRANLEKDLQPVSIDVEVNLVSEDAQKKFTNLLAQITHLKSVITEYQLILSKNASGEEIISDQAVTMYTENLDKANAQLQTLLGSVAELKSQNIQDIISDALTPPKEEPDFSHLSEPMRKEAERLKTQIEKIKEYMAMLQAIVNDPESTSEDKAAAQAGYDQLNTMLHGSDNETEGGGVEGTMGLENQLESLSNKNDKLEEHYAKVQKLSDAYNAFSDIATSALGAISKFSDEGTKAWLSFTITTLKSIGQMIVALLSLSQGEAAASAFKLPFPKNIAAYAIMASTIIGIFASLPKFAEGGIVGGGSMSGDKLIARVNSGEMILNNKQQRHLFNMINNGVASNNSAMGVQSIKVRGSDLYLALENYKREKHI